MPLMNDPISFAEYLDQYGTLTYSVVGESMLPLLRQEKDLFIVQKKGRERCNRGDVVLYHRPPNQFVLHRIIEVRPNDYVILGDNCIGKEFGITDADVLGVLTGFVRDGKIHNVSEPGYQIYTALWLHTISLRRGCKKIASRIGKLK